MNFKTAVAGNFTIAIDHVDGLFTADQDIFLRDNVSNSTFDLKSGAYNFASEAGNFNNRFEIVYQTTLGTIDTSVTGNNVVVYNKILISL